MAYDPFDYRFAQCRPCPPPPEPTRQEEQVREPNRISLAKKAWWSEKKAREAATEKP